MILRQCNVSVERLISDNGVLEPINLVIGQAIAILIPEIVHTVETRNHSEHRFTIWTYRMEILQKQLF